MHDFLFFFSCKGMYCFSGSILWLVRPRGVWESDTRHAVSTTFQIRPTSLLCIYRLHRAVSCACSWHFINKSPFFLELFFLDTIHVKRTWPNYAISRWRLQWEFHMCVCVWEDKQTCRMRCWKQAVNKLLPVNLCSSDRAVHTISSQACSQSIANRKTQVSDLEKK